MTCINRLRVLRSFPDGRLRFTYLFVSSGCDSISIINFFFFFTWVYREISRNYHFSLSRVKITGVIITRESFL